ncbi:MAG: hypothetical protein WC716_02190 [Chitinophagaceae bacterium]|jgi:hypothetical protein
MTTEQKQIIREFIDAFEEVFDKDWNYTKESLGIIDQTEEQKQNEIEAGLESFYFISPDGTFLNPKVEDETEDWGNRAYLLNRYRKLKNLLAEF